MRVDGVITVVVVVVVVLSYFERRETMTQRARVLGPCQGVTPYKHFRGRQRYCDSTLHFSLSARSSKVWAEYFEPQNQISYGYPAPSSRYTRKSLSRCGLTRTRTQSRQFYVESSQLSYVQGIGSGSKYNKLDSGR